MARRHLCGAVVLALGLALAGCSGSTQPGLAFTSPTMPAVPSTPSPQPSPSIAHDGNVKGNSAVSVTVAPDIFDQQGERYEEGLGDGWETSPAFLVETDDQDKAARALYAAAGRFMSVDQNGKELSPAEMTGDYPQYTPNYVSDVYLTELGPMIVTDTKGELSRGMAETMLLILEAELRAQGTTAHVIAPPADLFLEDHRIWRPPTENALHAGADVKAPKSE